VVLPDFMQPTINDHRMFGWRDDDNQVVSISVHQRVHIIGTLHNGDATYLIPMGLGHQLGFIPSDRHEMDVPPMMQGEYPCISRVMKDIWDSLNSLEDTEDIKEIAGWMRRRGVELSSSTLTGVLSTYSNLTGHDVRGIAEGMSSLLLGRGESFDCTDLPGERREKLCVILETMQNDPKWQECVSFFKTIDNK